MNKLPKKISLRSIMRRLERIEAQLNDYKAQNEKDHLELKEMIENGRITNGSKGK